MNRPTIVAGVDRSSASRSAMRWAAQRAEDTGSTLLLVHVIDDEWGDSAIERLEAESQMGADCADLRDAHSRLEVTGRCVRGNPSVDLARIADGHQLLVVGTHKTGFVQGRAFGSRSLRVAAAARVPVAVVPEHTTGARSGIVVGIDDSEAGREAVRFAAAEADRIGEDLILILAVGGGEHSSPAHLERQRELSAGALRIAEHTGADEGIRIRIVRKAAGFALVNAAASASLLVVGSSRRHTAHVVALGPVAHDVLFNITTPTIVVHPAQPPLQHPA